ncbi:tRNA (adenosine(37)-N6)-threonylcarbamoyltransferase complex ATPase subunit type 1 TsaE [Corynebacterium sp. LK2510]|uniref:tRNA (adenosine(37)-N6)-threonylcarbamoyltransferase complex ATPase subunit type 1 TsaE n=2 Tax=unclassified Corynebacterium TaxID=2624378 RepID=UPI0034CEE0AD
MRGEFAVAGQRVCDTAAQTAALGRELGSVLRAGDVVILDGPLGAGKTTLTQGIAQGLGVRGRVTSPTFVIAREHPSLGRGPALIHVDAYRLLGEGSSGDPLGELDALDLDTDLLGAVVVAEWGGGLVEQIAGGYLLIELDRTTLVEQDPDSEARIISWRVVGGGPDSDTSSHADADV